MAIQHPASRPCRCGSGQPCRELKDAHGIFCAFVCDACEANKRREFNPAIFDLRTYPPDDIIDAD